MAPSTTAAERAQIRASLDIQGTNSDIRDINIPKVDLSEITGDPKKLEELVGKQKAGEVSELISQFEKSIAQVNENADLLSGAEFDTWSNFITTHNAELVSALRSGDSATFQSVLNECTAELTALAQFFNEEIAQGLVATHSESGVRVYVNNGEIFVCTPDDEAFGHQNPEVIQRLESQVEGGKGLVYVPEGGNLTLKSTEYQDEQPLDTVAPKEHQPKSETKLLACRLDSFSYDDSSEEYSVVTHVRRNDDTLNKIHITFTRSQALDGSLRNADGFGNNGALPGVDPEVRSLVIPDEGDKTKVAIDIPPIIAADVDETAPASPFAAAGNRGVGTRGVRSAPPVVPEGQAVKAIDEFDATLKKPVDTPERLAQVLDDIENGRIPFQEAYQTRLAELEKARKGLAPKSTEAGKIGTQIEELKELRRNAIRTERGLLKKSWTNAGTDEAAKAKVAARVVALADDVNEVLTHDLSKCATEAERDIVRADQKKFNDGVAEFRKKYSTRWEKVSGPISRRYAAIKNYLTTRPGLNAFYQRYIARRSVKALERTTSAVSGAEPSAIEPKALGKQLKTLESDARLIDRRIAHIQEKIAVKPTPELNTELKTLQDARARSTLKQKAILEHQLSKCTDQSSRVAKGIKTKLYNTLVDEVDHAYRHLEAEGTITDAEKSARTDYKTRVTDYDEAKIATSSKGKIWGTGRFTDQVKIASRETAQAKAAWQSAPEATAVEMAQKTQLHAKYKLAQATELVAKRQVVQANAERALNLDPDNKELQVKAKDARTKVSEALELQEKGTRLTRLTEKIVLDKKIEVLDSKISSASPDEASKLKAERDKLDKQRTKLTEEAKRAQGEGAQSVAQRKVAELNRELKELEKRIKDEPDLTAKKKLQDQARKLRSEVSSHTRKALQAELDGTIKAKAVFDAEIVKLQNKLSTLTEGSPEAKACKAQIAEYTQKSEGLQKVTGLLTEQQELLKLKRLAEIGTEKIPVYQTELDALVAKEKASGTLAADDLARKGVLEGRIKDFQTAQTQYKAARVSWTHRISAAKQSALKMLKDMRQATYNPMKANSVLHTRIDAPGRYMERNPMKAAFIAAAVTETVHALTTADMSDDAVHTFVPSLLYVLEKPLEHWDVELSNAEFTTKEGGELVSRLAEVSGRVGNVGIVIGGMKLGQMGLARLPGGQVVLKGLGFASAPLTFAGAAYFGYAEFSDYKNWINDTETQQAGRVASPILMGAAAGSFFGPPGAVVGAGAAAIGEVAGMKSALDKLDADIDEEWERKGVRDSIKAGMDGYLLPSDHPDVLSRPPLTEGERGMLDDMSKELTLRNIFGLAFDRSRYSDISQSPHVFSDSELRAAGFIPPSDVSTQEEIDDAKEHNWNRLNELYDNVNPFGWSGPQFDELMESNPAVAKKFQTVKNTSHNHYRDLYRRSTRISSTLVRSQSTWDATAEDIKYTHWASPWTYFGTRPDSTYTLSSNDTNQRIELMSRISQRFRQRFDAREQSATTPAQKAALAQEEMTWLEAQFGSVQVADPNNPGDTTMVSSLHTIMSDPRNRERFLNYYETASQRKNSDGTVRLSGKPLTEYSLWTHMSHSEKGSEYLNSSLQDKMATDQIDAAIDALESFEVPDE